MLARMRTAIKFFTWGMLVGIFFAPESGAETRQRLKAWVTRSRRG
jgi:gas vesicle protein